MIPSTKAITSKRFIVDAVRGPSLPTSADGICEKSTLDFQYLYHFSVILAYRKKCLLFIAFILNIRLFFFGQGDLLSLRELYSVISQINSPSNSQTLAKNKPRFWWWSSLVSQCEI